MTLVDLEYEVILLDVVFPHVMLDILLLFVIQFIYHVFEPVLLRLDKFLGELLPLFGIKQAIVKI